MFPILFLALGLLIAVRQTLAPETAPILELLAWVLPVINRYITEAVKVKRPDLAEKLGGKAMSRTVGVIVFLVFAGLGLAARPEIVIPNMPGELDGIDWLNWLLSVSSVGTMLLYYTIRGSNDVHDKLEKKTPPPPPMPESPGPELEPIESVTASPAAVAARPSAR